MQAVWLTRLSKILNYYFLLFNKYNKKYNYKLL